jgi:hypothetical protein
MRSAHLCGFFLLLGSIAFAQVEHGGRPPSGGRILRRAAPTELLPPVHAELLLAEDAAERGSGTKAPLRFAEPLAVDLGLANAGAWEELGKGDRVWRLRIHSPGAKSLALVFSRFQLPQGGELYVYDDAREEVRGAYTELENRLDGEFAMRPLRGEALTLEYYEPGSARGRGELVLGIVAHDYRDVFQMMGQDRAGGGGNAGACEVDVRCALGANWANQINAAVHILAIAAGGVCSGSLLNNTANDGSLLVLSAAHCRDLSNAVFTFNFERPACRSGTAPCTNQITGATVLVSDEDLDVQLVRLDVPQAPLPYPVYLAGWDRSDVPPAQFTLIHHPAGSSKKISVDFDPPVIFNQFWRIRDWDRGVSEGGSSGAPGFDLNGRFIGNLDSGSSVCQVPTNDDFATRLAAYWSVLEPYLDPLGTGQVTLDGLDLANVTPQPFDVTGVFPTQVEALEPGIARRLRVLGTGFTNGDTLVFDGAPLDPFFYRRGGHSFFNVDLPPSAIGPHVLTVVSSAGSKSVNFGVVPCSLPKMQVANGIRGEPVFSFSGVDTIHADTPGHIHYCIWSLSNVPSISPSLSLLLGNGFTDLRPCRVNPIPPSGFLRIHHDIPPGKLPFGTRVYNQSVCVNHGIPLRTSNLQETVFQL